jgi:hypothetical protein
MRISTRRKCPRADCKTSSTLFGFRFVAFGFRFAAFVFPDIRILSGLAARDSFTQSSPSIGEFPDAHEASIDEHETNIDQQMNIAVKAL